MVSVIEKRRLHRNAYILRTKTDLLDIFSITNVRTMSSSSIFQRREGDLCSWVEPHKFDDLDEELEEQEYTMDELKQGYSKLADVLASAHIPFAALGGLAMALLGGREGTLTHDIDLQFKATPVELFNGLRKTEGYVLQLFFMNFITDDRM